MRKLYTVILVALLAAMLVVYIPTSVAQTDTNGLPAYTGGPAKLRMSWWGNDDRAERSVQGTNGSNPDPCEPLCLCYSMKRP